MVKNDARLDIRMPSMLVEKVVDVCLKEGYTVSGLIRDLLIAYLEKGKE
jgi:metal-responsive CopG/Arc/MetJ family transcriptional regulator